MRQQVQPSSPAVRLLGVALAAVARGGGDGWGSYSASTAPLVQPLALASPLLLSSLYFLNTMLI